MGYRSTGMQNLMRIESLIANNIQNILQKENGNQNHIYLYNAGELWVAFEKSAFQLEQISDDINTTMVMRLKDRPFPLVFNTISDTKVQGLCKQKRTLQKLIQISASPMDHEMFNNWYRDLVTE